jgi:hypothetical protein
MRNNCLGVIALPQEICVGPSNNLNSILASVTEPFKVNLFVTSEEFTLLLFQQVVSDTGKQHNHYKVLPP